MAKVADIKSGDLLIWSRDRTNKLSNILVKGVRLATMSSYGHVAISVWHNDELHLLEATNPRVRLNLVNPTVDEIFHINAGINFNNEGKEFLFSKIGLEYSMLDAIRGYLGITVENDDHWQCAEIVTRFYELYGINLNAFTPERVVRRLMEVTGGSISRVLA